MNRNDPFELVRLKSRDGTDTKLVRVGKKGSMLYQLLTEFSFRLGFRDEEQKEVLFIDPSGGPYIQVGYRPWAGVRVKKIYRTGMIELEKDESDISCNRTEATL